MATKKKTVKQPAPKGVRVKGGGGGGAKAASAKPAKAKPITPRRFERQLEVKLTDAEMRTRMGEMLAAMEEKDEAIALKSRTVQDMNADIKLKEKRVRELRQASRSGKELRDVECVEKFVVRTFKVETIRTDTHEVIEERPMSQAERDHYAPPAATKEEPKAEAKPAKAEKPAKLPKGARKSPVAESDDDRCDFTADDERCTLKKTGHPRAHAFGRKDGKSPAK